MMTSTSASVRGLGRLPILALALLRPLLGSEAKVSWAAWRPGGFDQADHREGDPGDHQQVVQERRLRAAGREGDCVSSGEWLGERKPKGKGKKGKSAGEGKG